MAARYRLLHDAVPRRAQIFCGIQDLLRRCDIVTSPREEIGWACYVTQAKLTAQTDKLALSKLIFLKELLDHLKVPATRQIDRVFIPALEVSSLARYAGSSMCS